MKLLCHVHGYPPHHNAGAEWMLYYILMHLKDKGWECEVLLPEPYKVETDLWGVKAVPEYQTKHRINNYREADIILTHLDKTGKAINNVRVVDKPLVHLIHNTHYNGNVDKTRHKAFCVYNSQYVKDGHKYKHPWTICRPHVPVRDYETNRGGAKYVTLINHWGPKGGHKMVEMAELAPEVNFLGVGGGYGFQIKEDLKNLTYKPNTPKIKEIYQVTKILIMPSNYESYGRTAIEAMASGIPVICSPTPGLKESCGDAGIFIDRDRPSLWVEKIQQLLADEELYKEQSQKCKAHAKAREKETLKDMDRLHEFLMGILGEVTKPKRKVPAKTAPKVKKAVPKKKGKPRK